MNFPVKARNQVSAIRRWLTWFWLRLHQSEAVVFCPLCEGKSFAPEMSRRWSGLSIYLVRCETCGLMLQSPRLNSEGLLEFYQATYRISEDVEHQEILFNRGQRRGAYIQDFLRDHGFKYCGSTVREVGCGYGGILERFRQEGCLVAGSDMDRRVSIFGQKKNLDIRHGTSDVLLDGTKADILLLSHILEHIAEPVRFLGDMKPLLKKSGLIYVEVPGVSNPRVIERGYAVQPGHLCYFSLDTLKNACQRAGYRFITGNEMVQALLQPVA